MLGIPFLSKFIEGTVKRQTVADSVDYLNYYITTWILGFFSLAISAKQYFGSPIQCWAPNEFKGSWEKYAENYCFIANSYHVPMDQDIPTDPSLRADHISYYRWVPIMLALQAFCFFIPNWLWNMLHKQTAVNPRAFLAEGEKIKHLMGEEREKEVTSLANYFMDTVSVFGHANYTKRRTSARSGNNAMFLYLGTKATYVLNIILQMIILNHFLGENYIHWGYQVALDVIQGVEWKESLVFPRVIMCDFEVRRLGKNQNYTIQCVIMMNMINEKLYLFLYFWFIFLAIVTMVNFVYYLVMLTIPQLRTRLVLVNMDRNGKGSCGMRRRDADRFVAECLHPDGVLLLQFLKEHVGGRVTYELTNRLMAMYTTQESFSDDSIEKHPHSPLLEKYSQPPTYHHFAPNKPFYPSMSAANKTFESAPPMDDYMDRGTMRVGEKMDSPRGSRGSPTEV